MKHLIAENYEVGTTFSVVCIDNVNCNLTSLFSGFSVYN